MTPPHSPPPSLPRPAEWRIRLGRGTCAACGGTLTDRAGMRVTATFRRIYHGDGDYCDLPNPPSPDPTARTASNPNPTTFGGHQQRRKGRPRHA